MMGLRASILAGLASTLVVGTPALAQEQAPEPGDQAGNIVVTGEREKPPKREVDRQAREITHSGGDELHRPLARMEDRLCPGVMGLKTDYAALMVERIRWNGERLGMWMAPDDACTPNLIIAFVEDGKAEIAELERTRGWMFQSLTLPERRALLAEEGPVRVWTTTVTRTRDGMPVPRRESLTAPPVVRMDMAHSKIYLTIREDITQVVVVFDRAEVRGKTLIQLADYATMRGIARTKPADAEAALDTILALFDDSGVPPDALTSFDQAYLRSLYEGIPNIRARSRLLGVNSELAEVIEEQAEAQK